MFLLTTSNVTNSHILTKKYFYLSWETRPYLKRFRLQIWASQSKVKESSYQVKQILELFLQISYFHFWFKLC